MRKEHMIVRVAFSLVLAISLVAILVSGPAQAFRFTYSASINLVNLDPGSATFTINFYNQDGTSPANSTISDSVAGNGVKNYYPLNTVPSGFNGAVSVSSNKPMASIVNVIGNNFAAAAAYNGVSQGSTTVYLPVLMKNNFNFNSWFNVQNVGTATANVTVNYSDGTTATRAIPVNGSYTFDQSAETHSATVFSARINSDQPIVAVVIQEDPKTLFAYTGFASGSTNPVFPTVNSNNFGYFSGLGLQNLGATDTVVTVSYTPAGLGTACTETQTIQAGKSATFIQYAFSYPLPTGAGAPIGWSSTCVRGSPTSQTTAFVGSARVTSNSAGVPLVGVVNQLKAGNNGEAYNGFDPNVGTNKVVFPLIMDRNFGYFTGFNIVNAGASSTRVVCTFTNTTYKVDSVIAAGASLNDVQLNKIANGYVGAGTCLGTTDGTTPDPAAKLLGAANQLRSSTQDELLVYEGINQ